jgi:hypothetical protein
MEFEAFPLASLPASNPLCRCSSLHLTPYRTVHAIFPFRPMPAQAHLS